MFRRWTFPLFVFSVVCNPRPSLSSSDGSYWQQRVQYSIAVELDPSVHRMVGTERLVYFNSSPDTIREVFYHLYLNAFKPGSMMEKRGTELGTSLGRNVRSLRPEEQGWTDVKELRQGNDRIQFKVHDTILRAQLDRPLLPGNSTVLAMEFESQIPKQTRRNGRDNAEGVAYSMAQWYPKLCEYDSEGWHDDQYVGREFYGVWGDFDVNITLPAEYVVGATGILQNPTDVRAGYDLGSRDTVWERSRPPEGREKPGTTTWRFRATNVHDFAWVADPEYIHEVTSVDGITVHLLYLPWVKEKWKRAAEFSRDAIHSLNRQYGRYPYPTFTVAQAGDGGMEYPQLIMIRGDRGPRSLAGVIAHEVGHNWFYGLIGNNESQEAWLDEGFATFVEDRFMNSYADSFPEERPPLERFFFLPRDSLSTERSYLRWASTGYEEPVLTHSDRFREDLSYSESVYSKGATFLGMLQYVVGDSLFDRLMRAYFDRWHYRHPRTRDFERVAEEVSGMDLGWFFDEWLRSTRTCDYAVRELSNDRVEAGGGRTAYRVTVELENKDLIVMPIDLVLTLEDGSAKKLIIPLGWKPKAESNAVVLPRWDWVDRTYTAAVELDQKAVFAEIDPSLRLADIDRTNNTSQLLGKRKLYFLKRFDRYQPIDTYLIGVRPSFWYSERDGFQLGVAAEGVAFPGRIMSGAASWYNTLSKEVDYRAEYADSTLGWLGRLTLLSGIVSKTSGVRKIEVRLKRSVRPVSYRTESSSSFGLYAQHLELVGDDYPFYLAQWERGDVEIAGFEYRHDDQSVGPFRFHAAFETSFLSRQFGFSRFWVTAVKEVGTPPTSFSLRIHAGYSMGRVPAQKAFFLAGAGPEHQFSDDAYHLVSNISSQLNGDVHLTAPGGGNLRGYYRDFSSLFGKKILAVNFDMKLENPLARVLKRVPLVSSVEPYLFLDVGQSWEVDPPSFSGFLDNFVADAGVELRWTPFRHQPRGETLRSVRTVLLSFFPFLRSLHLEGALPFWLSDPPGGESRLRARWTLRLSSSVEL